MKLIRRFVSLALCITTVFSLVRCSSDSENNLNSVEIPKRQWSQKFKPSLSVKVTDSTKVYDVILTVRVTTDYPFNNLWMYLTLDGPSGKIDRQPLEVSVTNAQGQWQGQKTGSLVALRKLVSIMNHPKLGTYKYTFEQGATEEVLPEVMDLSLELRQQK
jgi:gliding motility-associated lipoprotein GldH